MTAWTSGGHSWFATSIVAEFYTAAISQLLSCRRRQFRRRHDQLENHEPRRVLRERTFSAPAMPNRRKGASIGFDVRERQCSAGKSKNVNASRSLKAIDGFVVLGRVFSAKVVIAASATARFSESQSRRSRARWAEPTSAARERSGLVRRIVGDGSRERLRPGPSKPSARRPRESARLTDPAP